MLRLACLSGLVLLFGVNGWANADEDGPRLRDALALEEALQAAIKKAEPSIACVLVSRSDVYRRWFHEEASADPCKLGDFSPRPFPFRDLPADDLLQVDELRKRKRQDNRYREEQIDDAVQRDFDLSDPTYVPESYGSGVVINETGLVLTNFHVVQGATKVFVRLPGGKGSYADIHAADARCDLAVLRLLDRSVAPLPVIKIGDGSKLRKGQFVLSLANPFAAGMKDGSPSASWGIISNLRRRSAPPVVVEKERAKIKLHHFETLIQTDARLNLGCSGGALINLKGEMIGLTTSLAAVAGTESAGGYAVPMDDLNRAYVGRLEKGLPVEYGFLGIRFTPGNRPGESGRLFTPIPGSSAFRAGLRERSVILSVNGVPIRDNDDLSLAISSCLAGSDARLVVESSGGLKRTLTATLDKLYVTGPVYASQRPQPVRGLRVDFTSIGLQKMLPGDHDSGILPGVFVSEVKAGSPADLAGLQDKVILKVNGKPVDGPADFYRTVAGIRGPLELTVATSRGGPAIVKLDQSMRYAICNETFEGWDHARICRVAAELGYEGLEMAPFTLAPRITDVTAEQRRALRREAEAHGLQILGLHWLLAKTEGFQLTSPDPAVRQRTADYLAALAECCRDLGGNLMVFGSPAQRRVPPGASREETLFYAADTFRRALPRVGACEVTICMEPLAPPDADFVNTCAEAVELIDRVDHPKFILHQDVRAMSSEGVPVPELIRRYDAYVGHFHANDSNLRGPGFGDVDFVPIFQALKDTGYKGWVSVEVFDYRPDPETIARESIRYLRECAAKVGC